MKLLVELLAGVGVCGVVYYVARDKSRDTPSAAAEHEPQHASALIEGPSTPPASTRSRHYDLAATPNAVNARDLAALRNEVIIAAVTDMHRRGEDIMTCLGDATFSGAEKLRFAVDVSASAHEATVGQWRFVEIVDGEPLPSTFAPCADHAFGGGHRVVPPKGLAFPAYSGELSVVYTVPAPE